MGFATRVCTSKTEVITFPDDDGQGAGVVTLQYVDDGRRVERTDQRGVVTAQTFDDLGHLVLREYYGAVPWRSEQFEFDHSGRMTAASRGDGGLNRLEWHRTYDQAGRRLTESQVFAGQNGIGEPQVATYASSFSYVLDTAAHTMTQGHTTPANRVVTHTLDKLSRLVEVAGGVGVGATYTYDRAHRRTASTLANGITGSFAYDVNDRLTQLLQVAAPGGAVLLDLGYSYDAEGNRLFTRNGTPGLEGRSEVYRYDNLNRLTAMERGVLNGPGTAVTTPLNHAKLVREQQWANLDRRGNWRDYRWVDSPSGFPIARQQTRQVNGVNEYTMIDPDGTAPPWAPVDLQPRTLEHDAAGNLTLNPLATNAGDPCGTGVSACGSGQQYEYDEENRLKTVKRASASANGPAGQLLMAFEYDALGRRVHTIEYVDTTTGAALATPRKTRHIYVGLETVEEYAIEESPSADTATLLREFVWGDPRDFPDPVAMITHGGESGGQGGSGVPAGESVYHYLHDVLGSVVALTDSLGAVVERYTYDPYGRTLIEDQSAIPIPQSAMGNPFLWTGQRYDAAVGLYGFLFRAYSPELGRWLQRDPIEYEAGSISLYEYVYSAPMGWVDPFGEDGSRGSSAATKISELTIKLQNALDKLKKARDALQKAREAYKKCPNEATKKALEAAEAAYRELWQIARKIAEELDTLVDPSGNAMQRLVDQLKPIPPETPPGPPPRPPLPPKADKPDSGKEDGKGDGEKKPKKKSKMGKGEQGGKEHIDEPSPSKKGKHEEGKARKKKDFGGEKGDKRRPYRRK